ncbi:hypothetical protein PGB90_006365 [Kerria lacca]
MFFSLQFVEHKMNFDPNSTHSVTHFIKLLVKIGRLLAHLPLDDYGINIIEGSYILHL